MTVRHSASLWARLPETTSKVHCIDVGGPKFNPMMVTQKLINLVVIQDYLCEFPSCSGLPLLGPSGISRSHALLFLFACFRVGSDATISDLQHCQTHWVLHTNNSLTSWLPPCNCIPVCSAPDLNDRLSPLLIYLRETVLPPYQHEDVRTGSQDR